MWSMKPDRDIRGRAGSIGIVALIALGVNLSGAAAGESESLFNWKEHGGGQWQIENGTIVGRSGSGDTGWLHTKEEYGDFVLELDVKIEEGNSGIQVRSHITEGQMAGYQIEVDPSSRAWSGGLYDANRRGWLQNLEGKPTAQKAFKTGEWNHYKIRCVGDHIQTWVNGVSVADYRDSMDLSGVIALQVHSGSDMEVRYKNIQIEELGRHDWKPIWDGESFRGWHRIGEGTWKIEDGTLIGKHDESVSGFGHLVTDKAYKDLTVRVKYRAFEGNSGLYFRIAEKGFSGVTGFQAEIDPNHDAGGLYETNGRGWVVQPSDKEVAKFFHPDDWNQMAVSAHGDRVVVTVNGYRSAELTEDVGRRSGKIALQLHGGQDVHVEFKEVEILQAVQ